MEHSALHALEIIGLVIALGGVFFVLGVLGPAVRRCGAGNQASELARAFSEGAAKWVWRGAMMAAVATFLGIFVDVAEAKGKTVFNGVDFSLVWAFAAHTHVGKMAVVRLAVLLLMAWVSRLPGQFKWWLTGVIGLGAVVLTSFVSHAAAQPVGRAWILLAQVAHITAAAIWVGVLVQLLAARSAIEGQAGAEGIGLLSDVIRRFSPAALTVTSLLGLSGLLMILRFLAEFSALPTSAYGLSFVIKLLMLVPAIYAGAVNYRIVRPRLDAFASPAGTVGAAQTIEVRRKFGKMLELEVTAGILVLVVAGILASVSPPGEEGAYRATSEQMRAMLTPRLPAMNIVNPANFYGEETRSVDDLHYAEFTHHWSGVMVLLLGAGWLTQSFDRRVGKWASYGWPFLLVPFAIFVAVAADPEVWLLHRVSFREVVGDPQLLEHQLGAAMILLLVWLGWRDHRKPAANRPLGYALPGIFIAGGILLLGHAHSTLTITEGAINLINLEHAVFGAFMLLAGVVRWYSLRDLIPRGAANFFWPCMIIGLGIFMAFFYSEVE